jgi:muconolactone D-isomerase
MLFHVRMDVSIPHHLDPAEWDNLLFEEKARALELQRAGTWVHLWRVAGRYSNISVFEVPDGDALNDILWSLPLFRFMTVEVIALAQHQSSLAAQPS